jgi:hypothetical protein
MELGNSFGGKRTTKDLMGNTIMSTSKIKNPERFTRNPNLSLNPNLL